MQRVIARVGWLVPPGFNLLPFRGISLSSIDFCNAAAQCARIPRVCHA